MHHLGDGSPGAGYAAYLGPYERGLACQEQMTAEHGGDLVTRLRDGNNDPVLCLCYVDYQDAPVLRPDGMAVEQSIYVLALQDVLTSMGVPDRPRTRLYDQATFDPVKPFQHDTVPCHDRLVDADLADGAGSRV